MLILLHSLNGIRITNERTISGVSYGEIKSDVHTCEQRAIPSMPIERRGDRTIYSQLDRQWRLHPYIFIYANIYNNIIYINLLYI
jgi:hypothetical protein